MKEKYSELMALVTIRWGLHAELRKLKSIIYMFNSFSLRYAENGQTNTICHKQELFDST